jgi:hypothetical protein
MEWLDGETLGERIVRSPSLARARLGLARELGASLGRIHSICGVGPGTGQLEWLKSEGARACLTRWTATLDGLSRAAGVRRPALDFAFAWLTKHAPHDLPEAERVLCHGDFRNGNVIVGQEGLRAVLDWEGAHRGDRHEDAAWLMTPSWRFGGPKDNVVGGFGTVEEFEAGYRSTSGKRLDLQRLRWWTLLGSAKWGVICLGMGAMYAFGADRSIERAVVARRISEAELDLLVGIAEEHSKLGAAKFVKGGVAKGEEEGEEEDDDEDNGALDFPSAADILSGARRLLRKRVAPRLKERGEARASFEARVAANAISIVARHLELGSAARAAEHEGLRKLLPDSTAERGLGALRVDLSSRMRNGRMPLSTPGLLDHLLKVCRRQVAIDQPKYLSRY